jgi:hypothetical protein
MLRRSTLALVAALPTVLSGAVHAQPAGLAYPRPGVVCDSVGLTCYDSYGPSIGITQMTYGPQAGARLEANLRQTNNRDFRLSSGQACSVSQRTCWKDGWAASQVAPGLTNQLFGSGARPGQAQVARDTGLCSLSRSGQRVYDGPCMLKQVRQGGQMRYEVKLQNGNNYVFQQAGGSFQISDGFGGTWPVTFIDHGNTGIFRFGDYKLVATQENSNRNTNSNREAAVGNAIGNLLNALFQ